jgi:hypothetical protein
MSCRWRCRIPAPKPTVAGHDLATAADNAREVDVLAAGEEKLRLRVRRLDHSAEKGQNRQ